MPATNLPVNTVLPAGITIPLASAEPAGDNVNGMATPTNNGATTFLLATNTTAATKTITVTTPYTVAGLAIADQVYTLPGVIGSRLAMGPFDTSIYGPTLQLAFSATGVTILALQI